jgi:menaquinone-specific isochorismate synthase
MVRVERVAHPQDEAESEREAPVHGVEHRGTIGKRGAKIYTREVTATPVPISNARFGSRPLHGLLGADPEGWIRSLGSPSLPLPWFVYESPRGDCVVGAGDAARLECRGPGRFRDAARWIEAMAASARGHGAADAEGPVAVGAFGFGDGQAGAVDAPAVWIPSTLLRRDADGRVRLAGWQGAMDDRPRVRTPLAARWSEEGRAAWIEGVEAALRRIEAGTLEKVVLARTRVLAQVAQYDPLASFLALRERYPECHRFLVRLEDGTAFLGASPERLASLRERRIDADAVAGTTRVDGEKVEGAARLLRESAKERNEHEIVVREILAALRGCGASVEADPEPSTFRLRHVIHLRSRITGLAREGSGVLDLVHAIHPSPAVAGTPRDAALEMIGTWEPRDRGWYSGPVGWMDARGDGEFTLGLRSALLDGSRALLHAGAGIVAGSDPEREWDECEAKMRFVEEVLRG